MGDVDELDALPDETDAGALDRAVVLKLNGGLGTSMGMTGPKSLHRGQGRATPSST